MLQRFCFRQVQSLGQCRQQSRALRYKENTLVQIPVFCHRERAYTTETENNNCNRNNEDEIDKLGDGESGSAWEEIEHDRNQGEDRLQKSRLLKFIMSFDPGPGQAKAERRIVERGWKERTYHQLSPWHG